MLKSLKFIILTIFLLVLISFSGSVFATDVNLDLSDSSTDTSDSTIVQENNTVENVTAQPGDSVNSNTTTENPVSSDTNTSLSSDSTLEPTLPEEEETSNEVQTSGVSVNSTGTLPEEELGLSNILNIFLIVLGVLLLLLGLAILSQIKKQ